MRHSTFPERRLGTWAVLLFSTSVFAIVSPAARGAIVETLSSASMDAAPIFVTDPQPQWSISGDLMHTGIVRSGTTLWYIAPSSNGSPAATFNWSANLASDASSGGIADGLFQSGGSLSISGQIYLKSGTTWTKIFEGPLLQGTMSAFEIKESETNQGRLNLVGGASLTPTGGFLVDNKLPDNSIYPNGLQLVGSYNVSLAIPDAEADGAYIDNFQADVMSVKAFQFTLARPVPEPGVVLLLLGGLAGFSTRLRRRR